VDNRRSPTLDLKLQEGHLTDPTPDVQTCWWELVFMPQRRPPHQPRMILDFSGKAHSCAL